MSAATSLMGTLDPLWASWGFAIDATVGASVILVLGLAAYACTLRAGPALRHTVLAAALVGATTHSLRGDFAVVFDDLVGQGGELRR